MEQGHGRFLVITLTTNERKINGTVFEMDDGARLIVTAVRTRNEADKKASAAGPETKIFAVRPYWSRPAKEWIAADPLFWESSPAVTPQ